MGKLSSAKKRVPVHGNAVKRHVCQQCGQGRSKPHLTGCSMPTNQPRTQPRKGGANVAD